jgi:hypothetical protein
LPTNRLPVERNFKENEIEEEEEVEKKRGKKRNAHMYYARPNDDSERTSGDVVDFAAVALCTLLSRMNMKIEIFQLLVFIHV